VRISWNTPVVAVSRTGSRRHRNIIIVAGQTRASDAHGNIPGRCGHRPGTKPATIFFSPRSPGERPGVREPSGPRIASVPENSKFDKTNPIRRNYLSGILVQSIYECSIPENVKMNKRTHFAVRPRTQERYAEFCPLDHPSVVVESAKDRNG